MILLTGTFDGVHVGHMRLFQAAIEERQRMTFGEWYNEAFKKGSVELAAIPQRVVIGVLSDKLVKRYKGKPLYKERERMRQVLLAMDALGAKQFEVVVVENEADFFLAYPDSRIIVGSDWIEGVLTHWGLSNSDLMAAHLKVVAVPYTVGVSTTDLKARVIAND